MKQVKISYDTAEVVREGGNIRIIRFNGRYYKVFGRLFAVRGRDFTADYDANAPRYAFTDWDTLTNMYRIDD